MINRLDIKYVGKTKTPYLILKTIPFDNCIVCQKALPTSSHHLIPYRVGCTDGILADLRVRLCADCHRGVHPENGDIDGFEIIKTQAAEINNLRKALEKIKMDAYGWIITELDNAHDRYVKALPRQIDKLKQENNMRAIHPMLKLMEGRIKEIERIRRRLNRHIKSRR